MNISNRLKLSFGILAGLLIIASIANFFNTQSIKENQTDIVIPSVERIIALESLRFDLASQALAMHAYYTDQKEVNREQLISAGISVEESVKKYTTQLFKEKGNADLIKTITETNEESKTILKEYLEAIDANDYSKAFSLISTSMTDMSSGVAGIVSQELESEREHFEELGEETNSVINRSISIYIILFILATVFIIVTLKYLSSTTIKPLINLISEAEYISKGDLTRDIDLPKSKSEVYQLTAMFKEMQNTLRSIVLNVKVSAEELNSSSEIIKNNMEYTASLTGEILSKVSDTSVNATHNSESAIQSSKAMEETSIGIQRIAESTQVLQQTSVDANETSIHGVEIVKEAKVQMHTIAESTASVEQLTNKLYSQVTEIDSITKIITDITEKTNLLALNAAIEAARAGEHGKGFAVVATEVKKLAEQSKSSAGSIIRLTSEIHKDTAAVASAVKETIQSVDKGVDVISKAGTSFEDISVAINSILEQIEDISSTSEQMSAGAQEVTASVTEIANGSEIASQEVENIKDAINKKMVLVNEVKELAVSLTGKAASLEKELSGFTVSNK